MCAGLDCRTFARGGSQPGRPRRGGGGIRGQRAGPRTWLVRALVGRSLRSGVCVIFTFFNYYFWAVWVWVLRGWVSGFGFWDLGFRV